MTVFAKSLADEVPNPFWYYYAENADRTVIYAGLAQVDVPDTAFNHCVGIGTSTSRTVGFRAFNVQSVNDHTVTLGV